MFRDDLCVLKSDINALAGQNGEESYDCNKEWWWVMLYNLINTYDENWWGLNHKDNESDDVYITIWELTMFIL